ncbi:MAG: glycogen debranching enzyme N-terminal domain-containing protein, partial [Acidocella sp.]|nr:glycogen debranching enzyme N-terminal domain-containing protein [Acidocella sp.]
MPDPGAEYLLADGLGGYAMGTAGLTRTRRYHGLLTVASPPPARRLMLVNGLEAWLEQPGRPPRFVTRQAYADGVITPADPAAILRFRYHPWPVWRFALGTGTLAFSCLLADGAAEALVSFRPSVGLGGTLCVRPLLSGRDHHALHRQNPAFRFDAEVRGGSVAWRPYPDLPAIAALSNGAYQHAPEWYRNFYYAEEAARGLDDTEDLASPGVFRFDLAAGRALLLFRAGDGLAVSVPRRAVELTATRARMARRRDPACAYLADRAPGRT